VSKWQLTKRKAAFARDLLRIEGEGVIVGHIRLTRLGRIGVCEEAVGQQAVHNIDVAAALKPGRGLHCG
jgi:hypothetical protein